MRKSKSYILSFILLAFLLSSCVKDGTTINDSATAKLKPNHGYLAVRINSNKKFKQYLYYSKANQTGMSEFLAQQMRFVYRGNSDVIMTSLPAGQYYWSSFYTASGAGTTFRQGSTFEVLPNKTNYAGDIDILMFPRRNHARLKITDQSSTVRQEILKNSPDFLNKYPLATSIVQIRQ